MDKCDDCRKWTYGCELSGLARKNCMSQNFKFYKPKALGYSKKKERED